MKPSLANAGGMPWTIWSTGIANFITPANKKEARAEIERSRECGSYGLSLTALSNEEGA
jgi:hypothetical protein